MILAGGLAAGERLNEVSLAETLGISRGPLREAIQRLASEGLLRVVTHKGAYVRALSPTELTDLYELRIAIETHAVRLGIQRADAHQLRKLRALLGRTRAVLEAGDDAHYPSDLDLHEQLVELADSQALRQALRDTNARIHLARARSAYDPVRARAALAEHQEIVEHVLAGHGDEAALALEKHLHLSRDNALALLRHR